MGPNPTGGFEGITELAVSNTAAYAAGDFAAIGGKNHAQLAALNLEDGQATNWNPAPNSFVSAITVAGNSVYISGGFTSIGGQSRNRLAVFDATSGAASAWNPSLGSFASAIVVSDAAIVIGGNFTSVGGVQRNQLAALDLTTGRATDWNPSPVGASGTASINSIAFGGGTVYVGGSFISIGGQSRDNLAALDATTGQATAWNPAPLSGTAPNTYPGTINSILVRGSTVYVGGEFTSIGGQNRTSVAALNATTGQATDWNPNPTSLLGPPIIGSLAASDTTIYVGGSFATIGGQPRAGVAALNTTTGQATDWNPSPTWNMGLPTISNLSLSGSAVYVSGSFSTIGGQNRSNLAALNATDGQATAWNPNPSVQAGTMLINSLVVSGTTVFIGGYFDTIGGQNRSSLAEVSATTGTATDWVPVPAMSNNDLATINAISAISTTIVVGGNFTSINGRSHGNLAVFQEPPPGPEVTVSGPANGAPGSCFALAAANFAPSTPLSVSVNGFVRGTVTSNSAGDASLTICFPLRAPAMAYTVTITAGEQTAQTTLTLDTSAPLRTSSGSGPVFVGLPTVFLPFIPAPQSSTPGTATPTSTATPTATPTSTATPTTTPTVPTLPPTTVVQEDGSQVQRTGSWASTADAQASGGAYISSSTTGDSVTVSFSGDSVVITRTMDVDGGVAAIYIDNKLSGFLQFYFREKRSQVPAIIDNLGPGTHTLTLKVPVYGGIEDEGFYADYHLDPASTGKRVTFDAITTPSGYQSTATQQGILARVNMYRTIAGVPAAFSAQSLNQASMSAARYRSRNQDPDVHTHINTADPDFVGREPYQRGAYFGMIPGNGELVGGTGALGIDVQLNSVYHRGGIIGYPFVRFGSASEGTFYFSSEDYMDRQPNPAQRLIVTYPADGQQGVPLSWHGAESPDPLPDHDPSTDPPVGYVISLNIVQPKQDFPPHSQWSVTDASLRNGSGQLVDIYKLYKGSGSMNTPDQVYLIAKSALTANTTYTAHVSGTDDRGVAFDYTWTFTTINNTTSPTAPVLSAPADQQGNVSTTQPLTFSWMPSSDPDAGDVVTYTVTLTSATQIQKFGYQLETTFTLTPGGTVQLLPATTYTWSVTATDMAGHQSTSATRTFTTAPALVRALALPLREGQATSADGRRASR